MTAYNIFDHATETGGAGVTDSFLNLGVVFKPLVDGNITAVCFWKTSSDTATGRNVGLYNAVTGAQIGADTVSSGEPTGTGQWIRVALDSPLAVTADTPYMAVVHFADPSGFYPATGGYYASSDKTNAANTLTAYSSANCIAATGGAGNGRYTYFENASGPTRFADSSFNDTNYWVDVELTTGGGTVSLTASDLATASPVLDASVLGQAHALTGVALAPAAPALGAPALRQEHALTGAALVTASPLLAVATISQNDHVVATSLATGSPTLDQPAIGQKHNLAASPLAPSAPIVGAPVMTQSQALIADGITTAAWHYAVRVVLAAHEIYGTRDSMSIVGRDDGHIIQGEP